MMEKINKEYKNKSKEELINIINGLRVIECEDRCFANSCERGNYIKDITELFKYIDEINSKLEIDVIDIRKLEEINNKAKESLDYIFSGLSKMNRPTRAIK